MLTKIELKKWLLQDEDFIDNEYLDQYLDLLIENKDLKTDLYTEKHHVKPVACYKKLYKCKTRRVAQKFADSDPQNSIVHLLYKDHCKAHWLLYWCTKSTLRNGNAWTLHYMQTSYKKYTGKDKRKFEFVGSDFELLSFYMQQIIKDTDNEFWNQSDLSILKKYYSKLGASGIQRKLSRFRSLQAIRLQASLLKLPAPNFWTGEEVALLQKWYPIEGYFCYKRFKNKTKAAVQAKAFRLKLQSTYDWIESELQILTKWYPIEGSKCSKRLHHKSIQNINKKAHELGLKSPKQLYSWPFADVDLLKIWYPILGIECKNKLSKQYTDTAIYNKVRQLKIKKIINGWTPAHIDIVVNNYPNFKVIAKLIPEKSLDCIYSKVKELKKKGLIQNEKGTSEN